MDPKKRAWIWSGIALATGVGVVLMMGSAADATVGPLLVPGDRLLLLGDSLAEGLATPLGQLSHDTHVDFASDGRSGTRIADWASQSWLETALARRPKLVIVSLGTNDMLMLDPRIETGQLRALVARIKASGARQLWLMPPTMPFDDHGVRAMLEEAGMDLFPSDALDIPRGPDLIHPTAMGYAGWAGAVWQYLIAGSRQLAG